MEGGAPQVRGVGHRAERQRVARRRTEEEDKATAEAKAKADAEKAAAASAAKAAPAVAVATHPVTAMPDSMSAQVKLTCTSPMYQPALPTVPEVISQMMTGSVLSRAVYQGIRMKKRK